MGQEIERKFLVDKEKFKLFLIISDVEFVYIRQGFLSTDNNKIVRIRTYNEIGYITLKGEGLISRSEYEYEIPIKDAIEIIHTMCGSIILKKRYKIPFGNHTWEVDVFEDENYGLVVAEIELKSEDEPFEKPEWITNEVTGIVKYYNNNISQNPYKNWK